MLTIYTFFSDKANARQQKERESLEEELRILSVKSEDLESSIKGNGFTVSTRKERMRKTEMQAEKEEVDRRIEEIKEKLAQGEGDN